MKKIPFVEILKAFGIFSLGILIVVITAKITDWTEEPQQIVLPPEVVTDIKPKITCPADYNSFEDTSKRLVLIENKPSNGFQGILKGYKIMLERTGLTSDIACGYLYYEVSFDNQPIEEDYMALFMRPSDGQFGGHILPDEKKGAIIDKFDDRTRVLIPLDSLTYDGIERSPVKEANWVSLLNVTTQIQFDLALSADVPEGKINFAQIAYKCINKETGKETDTCSLRVISTQSFGF